MEWRRVREVVLPGLEPTYEGLKPRFACLAKIRAKTFGAYL